MPRNESPRIPPPPDVQGEIAKALLVATFGDTLEWDFATEEERDRMRAIAADFEPTLRRTVARLCRWLEGCNQ